MTTKLSGPEISACHHHHYYDIAMTTAQSWLETFSARLGMDVPSEVDMTVILELAGSAAHSSQRSAAPVACWLAARAGFTPDEALVIARTMESEDS